ncbi:uncharacterized protein LOC134815425 [Bolinopsis microptera]|uniref:uncharacterized protein LOC134815425 n=1 Tax=Bolinopsis microptera TaxID=2820187 RepID=UPI00307ACD95
MIRPYLKVILFLIISLKRDKFCLAQSSDSSCWEGGTGSYPTSHKLGQQQFTDYLTCQNWCDEDPNCVAAVVSRSLCVKLASEDISSQPGSQAALKDCWQQTTVTATTTAIGDDKFATARCANGYKAVDCYSNYPMSSILDGVTIYKDSCYVSMSASSRKHVDVTATCRKERTCSTNTEITKYKHLKQANWVTGGTKLECPPGYELLGCYITSAWSPGMDFKNIQTGGKTIQLLLLHNTIR